MTVTQHTMVVIGWLGSKRAYMDIPPEEAIERYARSDWPGDSPYDLEMRQSTIDRLVEDKDKLVSEFMFKDEFGCYDAWEAR